MEATNGDSVMQRVRRALGREKLETAPTPPVVPQPIARLVHTDIGLPELFTKRAAEMHMQVSPARPDQLAERLVEFFRENQIQRVVAPLSPLFERLGIVEKIRAAGVAVKLWSEITLDEIYDGYDCGLTDAMYGVAETGSLAIKPSAQHGRSITLVPMYHVAVIEPKNLLPDLIDLMEKLAADPDRSNWILISGPSKTADIEMNVVTGVHGPNVVRVFILQ